MMKKRLLALLLAVVTVAAMIPAMLVPISAATSGAGAATPSWGEQIAASYGKDLTTGTRATALKHGTDVCFGVYDAAGNAVKGTGYTTDSTTGLSGYKTWDTAWAAMKPGCTLKLLGNVHATGFETLATSLSVAGTYTVDGCGFVFDVELSTAKTANYQYVQKFTIGTGSSSKIYLNFNNFALLSNASCFSFTRADKKAVHPITMTDVQLYAGDGYSMVDSNYYPSGFARPAHLYVVKSGKTVPANGYLLNEALYIQEASTPVTVNGVDSVIYGRNAAVRGKNIYFTLNNGLVKTDDQMYTNTSDGNGLVTKNQDSAAIYVADYSNSNITINGGRVVNTYSSASGIRVQDGQTVNINGGEFYTTGSAIHVRGAQAYSVDNAKRAVTITVKAGLFVALPAKSGYSATQHNGFFTTNNTTNASNGNSDPTSVVFNVSGGVYFNERPETRAFASTTVTEAIAKFNITGGVFLSKVGASDNLRYLSQAFDGDAIEPVEPTFAVVGGEEIARDGSKTIFYNGTEYYICHEAIANSTAGAPTLYEGAQVRLVTDSNGIRFVSNIQDYSASNTYGTIIVPTEYVINALAKYGNYSESSLIKVSSRGEVANIPAQKGIYRNEETNSHDMYAALTNLSDEMLDTAFCAITYKTTGSTTVYSTPSLADGSRSIAQVAALALSDTSYTKVTEGKKTYENPSVYSREAGTTLYSRYTEEQQEGLKLLLSQAQADQTVKSLKSAADTRKALNSSAKTVSLDLSDYEIVMGQGVTLSDTKLASLATYLGTAIGQKKFANRDTATKILSNKDKEILIGDTKRAETEAAKKRLSGDGYVVELTENKVVVYATDDTYLYAAIQYLHLKYFVPEQKATFSRTALCSGDGYMMKEFASNTAENISATGNYIAVYDNILDDVMYHNTEANGSYKTDGTGDCPEPNYRPAEPYDPPRYNEDNKEIGTDGKEINYIPNQEVNRLLDYAVDLCRDLGHKVSAGRKIAYTQSRAKDTDAATDYEIYMGYVDRADAQAVLANIAVNEYAIYADGTKIMLLAWNDNGLELAYQRFLEILAANNYRMPQNYAEVTAFTTSWITSFPKPEFDGLKLTETVDTYNSSLEYIYSGTGATAANFKAYCQTLVAAGYVLNNENEIEQSLFRTYYNKATSSVLHVSYSNYSYANTYNISNWQKSIRIVSIPFNRSMLIDNTMKADVQKQSYQRLTDPMITAMSLSEGATGNIGANYIFTLEDGSFFLIDGGNTKETDTYNEDHMWELLNKLYVKTHGHEPTAEDPIVITGWFLTHYHGDHTGTMRAFCTKYGTNENIVLKYFIANLPSKKETFNACGGGKPSDWYSYIGGKGEGTFYDKGAKFLEVHAGYKFTLVNMEFEVLYTSEDMHPFKLDYENETSVVIKSNIYTTNGAGVIKSSTSFLMTGDMGRFTGQNLVAMYGQYLKSDQMTVAHHGWVGPFKQFYDMVRPHILWWPAWKVDYEKMISGRTNQSDWYHIIEVDPYIATKLSSVCYIITRDNVQDKDDANIYDYTLVLDQNGIDYKDLRNDMIDAFTDSKITAYETNTFDKTKFTYVEEPEFSDRY